MRWDSLLQGRNVHSSETLLPHLPRAEHVPYGGNQGVRSSSQRSQSFFINSALALKDAMPQAVLLIRRCFVNYTDFQKMQTEGLRTTPWKAALPFRRGGLALSKSDHGCLVLECTRVQYYCACFRELYPQCSEGKNKKEGNQRSFL